MEALALLFPSLEREGKSRAKASILYYHLFLVFLFYIVFVVLFFIKRLK